MEKVIVTRPFTGLASMQVCAEENATDEEILRVCNQENPSGTTGGWGNVIRGKEQSVSTILNDKGEPNDFPVPCATHKNRTHFIVLC